MYASARTFSFTFAASIGLHGLLLLAAAAFMTVVPDFGRENSRRFNALESILSEPGEELEPPELQEVEIAFLTEAEIQKEENKKQPPEVPPKSPVAQKSGEKLIYAPEDRPSLAPLNRDTPFISSQNMRAASTSAPTPGADPNLINQEGRNRPYLSLKNSAFSEGREAPPPARQEPPQPIQDTPPPPKASVDPVADSSPASKSADSANQRPPEPANTVQTSDPLAPASADKPAEPSVSDTQRATTAAAPPALREKPLEPVAETKVAPPPPRPRDPVARREESKNGRRASLSSLKTKSTGAVAEQGEASVDARDTPEGRYGKIVHDIINPIWNRKLAAVRGLTGVGVVEVSFEIDVRGKVSNVRLVDPGKANPVFEDVCLTSIIQAKLPPPPDEMQEEMRDPLSNGRLRRSVSFFKQY